MTRILLIYFYFKRVCNTGYITIKLTDKTNSLNYTEKKYYQFQEPSTRIQDLPYWVVDLNAAICLASFEKKKYYH